MSISFVATYNILVASGKKWMKYKNYEGDLGLTSMERFTFLKSFYTPKAKRRTVPEIGWKNRRYC